MSGFGRLPNNPVGMGCFGAIMGFLVFGMIGAWLGNSVSGPSRLVVWAGFIAMSSAAGFTLSYRRQKPRHAGQSLGGWIGFDFIAANVGCVAGFVLVALLAVAGIVTNDAWLLAGCLAGFVLGFGIYHVAYALWQRRRRLGI